MCLRRLLVSAMLQSRTHSVQRVAGYLIRADGNRFMESDTLETGWRTIGENGEIGGTRGEAKSSVVDFLH